MKIVEPLTQLAMLLRGSQVDHIWACIAWSEMEPIEREPLAKAVLSGQNSKWERIVTYLERVDIEFILHDAITIWAMQAFECLREMDRKKCPPNLGKLYDKVNKLRIQFNQQSSVADWVELIEIYGDAISEIDEYVANYLAL
jgi:hypothetical protein